MDSIKTNSTSTASQTETVIASVIFGLLAGFILFLLLSVPQNILTAGQYTLNDYMRDIQEHKNECMQKQPRTHTCVLDPALITVESE